VAYDGNVHVEAAPIRLISTPNNADGRTGRYMTPRVHVRCRIVTSVHEASDEKQMFRRCRNPERAKCRHQRQLGMVVCRRKIRPAARNAIRVSIPKLSAGARMRWLFVNRKRAFRKAEARLCGQQGRWQVGRWGGEPAVLP